MRKNQLIEQLQKIKGNPEIKMWNGFVEDWTNIELVECELVKRCKEYIRWGIEEEWKQENRSWEIPADVQQHLDDLIKEQVKEEEWDFPNQFIKTEEESKRWYSKNRKKFVMIDAKKRNKSTYDRLGAIHY
jgi:hypothetical protein